MTLLQLEALIKANELSRLINIVDDYCLKTDFDKALKELIPQKHKVNSLVDRPNKLIYSEPHENQEPFIKKVVQVARIYLPIQKDVVTKASAFLGVPTIQATAKPGIEENLLELIKKAWKDNKLDYRFRTITKTTMSERESAELWYTEAPPEGFYDAYTIQPPLRLQMRILSRRNGDTLYPVFDLTGKMIAFGRKFEANVLSATYILEKIEYYELYTDVFTYYFIKGKDGIWKFDESKTTGGKVINAQKKIPIVYYFRDHLEWEDIQCLIERLETKASNHADTNDYFDAPIVFAEGLVKGFADKGESGKVLEGEEGSKVSYLTWDSAPESMKLELENLQKWYHKFSQTPDISFESMKGVTQVSGIMLKMLFMDAHLKASDNEETFGEGVQRRLNLMGNAFMIMSPALKAASKLEMEPKFTYFLPKDEVEEIANINSSVSGGIMSVKTAVSLNPLVKDPVSELEQIKLEKTDADKAEIAKTIATQPPKTTPTN